jgi:hypothetical protein
MGREEQKRGATFEGRGVAETSLCVQLTVFCLFFVIVLVILLVLEWETSAEYFLKQKQALCSQAEELLWSKTWLK